MKYREVRYDANADGCWPVTPIPIEPGVMNVLYKDNIPIMCEYLCPCGCGMPHPMYFETSTLKRSPNRHLWNYSLGPNGPTLTPSVRCLSGCKSHYNITNGEVIMHGDSGK